MFCCNCAKDSSDDELFQERNHPKSKEAEEEKRESPFDGKTDINSELIDAESKCVKSDDNISNRSKDPEPKSEVSETIEAVETQKNFTAQPVSSVELATEEEIMSKELTNAVFRLEAVASRLENIVKCQQEEGGPKVSTEPGK